MVGAYVAWIMMSMLGLPPVVGIVAAVVGCTMLGVMIEKVAYTPLRKSPRLSLLITAIRRLVFPREYRPACHGRQRQANAPNDHRRQFRRREYGNQLCRRRDDRRFRRRYDPS